MLQNYNNVLVLVVKLLKYYKGIGEMAQWLMVKRTDALPENQSSVPSIHMASSRGSSAPFWPLQALHARGAQTGRPNTHTCKIKIKKKLLFKNNN